METKSTIWEKVSETYIPVLLLFFGTIAGATCIGTKPFFPVGVSGIIMIALVIFCIEFFFRKKKQIKSIQTQLEASYDSLDSVTKKYRSDIVKKDEKIKELEADVELLKAQVASFKSDTPAVIKVEDIVKEKKASKKK